MMMKSLIECIGIEPMRWDSIDGVKLSTIKAWISKHPEIVEEIQHHELHLPINESRLFTYLRTVVLTKMAEEDKITRIRKREKAREKRFIKIKISGVTQNKIRTDNALSDEEARPLQVECRIFGGLLTITPEFQIIEVRDQFEIDFLKKRTVRMTGGELAFVIEELVDYSGPTANKTAQVDCPPLVKNDPVELTEAQMTKDLMMSVNYAQNKKGVI